MTNKYTKDEREEIERAARNVDDARAVLENVIYDTDVEDYSALEEIHIELEGLEVKLSRIVEGK